MRYYLSKQDVEDGIVCNIITDVTYDTRISDNGFLIKYNFKEVISKDIVLMNKEGLMCLRKVKHPETNTLLNQSFDSWINMMTGLNRLYINTDFYESKVLLKTKGMFDSIVPYDYYNLFRKRFGRNVRKPLIPKILTKLIKKLEALPMKTSDLKTILEKETHRLKFDLSKIDKELKEIIIMPKKPNQDTERDVYVNGIHQRHLRGDHPWLGNWRDDSYMNDYRFLLGLDTPPRHSNNMLVDYFVEAIPTSQEDVNFEVGPGRTLFEAEENASKIDSKPELNTFGVSAVSSTEENVKELKEPSKYVKHYIKKNPANKVILTKEEAYARYLPSTPITTVEEIKPRTLASVYLMTEETAEKIKREDYLKVSNNDIRLKSKLKKKEDITQNQKNRVCVKDTQSNEISRMTRDNAAKLVGVGERYVYVSKKEWKEFKKKQRDGVWKDGLHKDKTGKMTRYTGINRKQRHIVEKKPGHSIGSGPKALRLTTITKLIPAHTETIERKTFKLIWEEKPFNFKKEGWSAYDERIRKKREYYQTKSGKWKYHHAFEIVSEMVEVTIPEKYVFKTIYTMGFNSSRKTGTHAHLAQVGIVRKPMKVKEKKVYEPKVKPTKIVVSDIEKAEISKVNRENAKKNRKIRLEYVPTPKNGREYTPMYKFRSIETT